MWTIFHVFVMNFFIKKTSIFELVKYIMLKVIFAPVSVMYIEDDGALF